MKIKIISLIIILCVFLSTANPVRAGFWGSNFGAAGMKQMLEEISKVIQDAILGAVKQEAATMINDTVNNVVSGASESGAMFITDWENYLFAGPRSKTSVFMNDFFSITTKGRQADSNYLSECLGLGNYSKYLVDNAKVAIEVDLTGLQTDLEQFACNKVNQGISGAGGIFNGGWRTFNAWATKSANNPVGYALNAQKAYMDKLEKEEKAAAAKASAYQGFKGKEENGVVVSPGSLIKDVTSESNTVYQKMIASAKSVPEVAAGVATQVATKAIKVGIGNARRNAQREINQEIDTTYGGINDSLGPNDSSSGYYKPSY